MEGRSGVEGVEWGWGWARVVGCGKFRRKSRTSLSFRQLSVSELQRDFLSQQTEIDLLATGGRSRRQCGVQRVCEGVGDIP